MPASLSLLVIADRRPEVRATDVIKQTHIDVILTLGDLEHSDIRDLELITDIPKLGVYGNHCSGLYFEELGIQNMHLSTFDFKGVRFGGFEGCVRYKESRSAKMYTQDEASALLSTFPRVDVMLTHCPPYGVNDEPDDIAHMGFLGLHDYVLREKPAHLFHGHTYPKPEELISALESTRIHYVFGHKVIQIEA